MIYYKTNEEVELIRQSCILVNDAIAHAASFIKPGISTLELNDLAEEYIVSHGAAPNFKNYHGFPFACCISVNDAVVHGFPTEDKLKEGDIVSIDCGAVKKGYHGDSAYTFAIGDVSEEIKQLMRVTKESLYKGIEKAIKGNRLSDISHAVQLHAESHGYGVVRDYVGHGIGQRMHEDPQIPNYGPPGRGPLLKNGMVLAIEPMINLGTPEVEVLADDWTVVTADGKISAHFEHTVAVTDGEPLILTLP